MTNSVAKLAEAEALQQRLLDEMNAIDRELTGLQPSDPRRPDLKAKKAEILPRYRGAKQHAKDLRRLINSQPQTKPEVVGDEDDEDDEDEVEETMFSGLCSTMCTVLDCVDNEREIRLGPVDVKRIRDFVEWFGVGD